MVTKLSDAFALPVPKFDPKAQEAWELREKERQREAEEWEAQQKRIKRAERTRGFRCTDAMRDALLDATYAETDAVKRARDWYASRDKPWLLLSGPTGCGKSMAAASIPVENYGADFVRADELVRVFASMFGELHEQQQRLRDVGLLVIDDLGCELDHARMLPALLDLLDARQSARRHPTIVTTNLTAAAFRERYANDRLNSRMAELVRWEGLTGDDMRRKK